ncbi:hypothetical protein ACFP1Z_00680 [Streptomyces gamaensis]|uniref:Uncharacterized protein n=1 Tax=Streptomyces gamaensis TaxID=1763542 RepID=A0ABW0YQ48_9ACTN
MSGSHRTASVGGRPTVVDKMLGVSPGTLYNHIPDLRELRASRIPAQLGAGVR